MIALTQPPRKNNADLPSHGLARWLGLILHRRWLFVALAMWESLGIWRPSVAQPIQAPPSPAQIVAITPSEPSPTESRLVLSFSQQLPQFSIIGNDATTTALAFADAKLAPNLLFPGGRHGVVESMNFSQNSNILTLTLTGTGPIHVIATPLAARAITIVVSSMVTGPKQVPEPVNIGPHADGAADEIFEVVPLKYADVSEVVGLLTANQSVKPNDHFTPEEPAFGSAGMQGAYPGVTNAPFGPSLGLPGPTTDSVGQAIDDTTGIDRRLNAIVLHGPPARIAKIEEQIAKLDVPVSSVVFETMFVELNETGARNVGLDFNNANNQIATIAYSYANGDFPGVANTAHLGGVAVNLQLAISGQIAKGNGRILSKPRIAAQSGASAKIITGDALPILTSIALSGVNAVQQQVQYVNVGVTLQIAPRVSNDGFVTSHVFAEVSSVTGVSQGYPTISQREASTSATVRDGESFVIGGLTQETELSNHNKVPGLGDVPLLGELFKSEHADDTRTDLYIVVTPHVVTKQNFAPASQEGGAPQ